MSHRRKEKKTILQPENERRGGLRDLGVKGGSRGGREGWMDGGMEGQMDGWMDG